MSYHVTFGEHKRILNIKKDDLVDTVKREFQLRTSSNEILHFKIWNDAWKDWVDIDIENIPSSCKLNISVIESVGTSPVFEALNALYGQDKSLPGQCDFGHPGSSGLNSSLDKSLPGQCDFGHPGSSGLNSSLQSNTSFEDDVLEIGIASTSQYFPNAMSSKITSTEVSQPKASYSRKWPQSYKLPTIPRNIEALTVLGRKERSIIIEILYHDMAQYTMYPKGEQYTEVVQTLLEAFPHWGDKSPVGKPWDTLRQKLIDKFKNERSRHYPSVTLTPKKRKKPENYSKHKVASIQDGEDKETIERHVLWLRQEYNKLKPNRCRMQHLMDLTYPIRDFKNKSIQECFKDYPFLKDPEQLVREVFRWQNIDMVQVAISNLQKLPTDLATKCNVSSHNTANDALASVLLTMADYMKDDRNDIFQTDTPTGEYSANPSLISESEPPVNSNSTFKLIVEEMEIFKNAGIVVSTAAFIAIHAIFNLKYRKASATIGGFETLFGLACSVDSSKRKLKSLVKALR